MTWYRDVFVVNCFPLLRQRCIVSTNIAKSNKFQTERREFVRVCARRGGSRGLVRVPYSLLLLGDGSRVSSDIRLLSVTHAIRLMDVVCGDVPRGGSILVTQCRTRKEFQTSNLPHSSQTLRCKAKSRFIITRS